ncbi:IBR finger domain protein [Podospora didyma]|uniref:IBR finger domain protein n=1 Tax=Podospora didyma TaxID=330526 RepID=A0AAE0NHT3_9PEZI|nr:IBR finger domain protein [Podospora didyma]
MGPQKRTILITGCSDGSLGAALALAFHKQGSWRVFASARNTSRLKDAEAAGIETVQLDTLSDASIAASVSRVAELTGGSLDALINNAGAAYSLPLMDVDLDKARGLFDLNVFSVLAVTRACLPLLLKSTAPRGAMVINNTSAASQTAGTVPFQGIYNASKAAAASLTEVLRLELAPFGVRVINLVTGSVKSNFFDNAPKATLPPGSMYNVAKAEIEEAMTGKDTDKNGADQAEWASQVVGDLSRSSPPHWVWRGTYVRLVWLASFLPLGVFDGKVKKMYGLDVLERKVKEEAGGK